MSNDNLSSEYQELKEGNKTIVTEIQSKRDSLKQHPLTNKARNVFFGLGIAFLFVFFVLFALQVIAGLFAFVLCLIIGVAVWFGSKHITKLDSVIRQKVEIYVLEKKLETAKQNHIVQLKALVLKKKDKIENAKRKYTDLAGQVQQLKLKATQAQSDDPYRDQKRDMYEQSNSGLQKFGDGIKRAQEASVAFERKVGFYEDMAKTAAIAKDIWSALSDDSMDEMLSTAAFDQIETEFCSAMAELDAIDKF